MWSNLFVLVILESALAEYQPKIYSGSIATIEDNPHIVSIQEGILRLKNHLCGGSILNEDTILTAAHCLNTYKLPLVPNFLTSVFLYVRAGSTFSNKGGELIPVKSFYIHPGYNPKTNENDIAVMKLKRNIKFDGKTIKAIDLATQRPATGSMAKVAGWGMTKKGITHTLNSVGVPVLDQEVCEDSYPKERITPSMLCAGYEEGGKDSCVGDSGGPLVFKNKQIGIVSWGYACGAKGNPGIYTDVSKHLEFIMKNSRHLQLFK